MGGGGGGGMGRGGGGGGAPGLLQCFATRVVLAHCITFNPQFIVKEKLYSL